MDNKINQDLQSATFERLIKHLRDRNDVQNIDLMKLSGFCRNCLSKWYKEEADKKAAADAKKKWEEEAAKAAADEKKR